MNVIKRLAAVLVLLALTMMLGACGGKNDTPQVFTGYITSEDDFAAGLNEDTAFMVYMEPMARSGLGITFQENGKWVFYYFDGKISTGDSKDQSGEWMFDGTGSQLTAWNIVKAQMEAGGGADPVPVKVTGVLKGDTATNPGPDKDGKYFKVITVSDMTTADDDSNQSPNASEASGAPSDPISSQDGSYYSSETTPSPAGAATSPDNTPASPSPVSASPSPAASAAPASAQAEQTAGASAETAATEPQPAQEVTFTGFITSEDDFAMGLGEDTAAMVYMRLMALSGLGITFEENGKWVFYYFDGTFSTDNTKDENGNWVFDGTGTQKKAWDIVGAQMTDGDKMDSVPVVVTGILKGNKATNPGPDKDGLYFEVLTVTKLSRY